MYILGPRTQILIPNCILIGGFLLQGVRCRHEFCRAVLQEPCGHDKCRSHALCKTVEPRFFNIWDPSGCQLCTDLLETAFSQDCRAAPDQR